MAEQRRIGYKWNLRTVMAQRNLWKSTELMPLLKSRGINLSESQVYRLVTGTPERIPARTGYDRLVWPHRDGLIWPLARLAGVVMTV